MTDTDYMKQALLEAQKAGERGEVPVGAVVVCKDRIIARAHNLTETLTDVTAHAEMQAITAAAATLGGKYLNECTLYVTVEPCRKDADPRLGTLLEHHHHAVALSDARAKKEVGAAIAKLAQIAEGVHPAVAVVGTPEQRVFRRVLHGPFVYYVIGKIEAGRNANLIVRLQVLVGFKFRAFEKFF